MYGIPRSRPRVQVLAAALLLPLVLGLGCGDDAPPALEATPGVLDLGGVAWGAGAEAEVRLLNPGEAAVTARLALTGDPGFELDGASQVALAAGEAATVRVRFTPTGRGPAEGALSVRTCETCAASMVRLLGTGLAARLRAEPSTLDFGRVEVAGTQALSLRLVNEGDALGTVSRLVVVPNDPAFRLEAPATPFTLEPGEGVEVGLTFAPEAAGPYSVALEWSVDDPDAPLGRLVAIGQAIAVPRIEAASGVGLGEETVAVTREETLVIARNVGGAPLEVTSVERVSGDAFEVEPLPGTVTLAPRGVLPVQVRFTPDRLGPLEATLRVHSSDPERPELDVTVTGEGVGPLPCELALSTAALDLGPVHPELSYRRELLVSNPSPDAACRIAAVRLSEGSDPALTLSEGGVEAPFELEPGSAHRVVVDVRVVERQVIEGSLEVVTAHPLSGRAVPVSASVASTVALVPTRVDLRAPAGCGPQRRPICVYNGWVRRARVTGSRVVGSTDFRVDGLAAGTEVAAGARTCGEVVYSGAGASNEAAELEVTVDLLPTPLRIPVTARAPTVASERFVQGGPVDLLVVMDDSGGMAMEQDAMAANVSALVRPGDWQAGVTVTDCDISSDCGRLRPLDRPEEALVRSTDADPEARLAANLATGDQGSATERGLDAAFAAFSGRLAGPNAELLRTGARLALVVVTDEAEQSAHPVDFYLDWMHAITGAPNAVTVSAVAAPAGGCSGAGGSAEGAPRLVDLAQRTGGAFESICTDDWAAAMASLGEAALGGRRVFLLEGTPDPGTLEVRVDGLAEDPLNWSWDAARNAVVFTEYARPHPGQEIAIRYVPVCG